MNRRTRTLVVVAIGAHSGRCRHTRRVPPRPKHSGARGGGRHGSGRRRSPSVAHGHVDQQPMSKWCHGRQSRPSPVASRRSMGDEPGCGRAVVENEPDHRVKLAPARRRAGLAAAIPEGMRAISVKVNEVIGVAGFVDPGTTRRSAW